MILNFPSALGRNRHNWYSSICSTHYEYRFYIKMHYVHKNLLQILMLGDKEGHASVTGTDFNTSLQAAAEMEFPVRKIYLFFQTYCCFYFKT